MDEVLIAKIAGVLAWFLLLFCAERRRPAAPLPAVLADSAARRRRVGRNLALWAVNSLMSRFVVIPLSALAAAHSLDWRPAGWSGWPTLLLDLLLLDFLIYWWHRLNHELPLLWRFHQVHHRDRFLDSTTALRFHFGEVLLSAVARGAIIWLLAIPLATVLLFEILVLAAAIFHHSNLRLGAGLERALSRVIVTPSIHWVHHHAVRADTDSNYATILSLWDPLFGSRSRTERQPTMPIGAEGAEEKPLRGLIALPFRSRR
jgi:sterol desaturase/sphingolipid hydroxylase (fatty acid hydroxylase superfamily)